MKSCACGRIISPQSWPRLPLLGTIDNGRDAGELLELRLCDRCRSTLSVPIGEHAPSSRLLRAAPRAPFDDDVAPEVHGALRRASEGLQCFRDGMAWAEAHCHLTPEMTEALRVQLAHVGHALVGVLDRYRRRELAARDVPRLIDAALDPRSFLELVAGVSRLPPAR